MLLQPEMALVTNCFYTLKIFERTIKKLEFVQKLAQHNPMTLEVSTKPTNDDSAIKRTSFPPDLIQVEKSKRGTPKKTCGKSQNRR